MEVGHRGKPRDDDQREREERPEDEHGQDHQPRPRARSRPASPYPARRTGWRLQAMDVGRLRSARRDRVGQGLGVVEPGLDADQRQSERRTAHHRRPGPRGPRGGRSSASPRRRPSPGTSLIVAPRPASRPTWGRPRPMTQHQASRPATPTLALPNATPSAKPRRKASPNSTSANSRGRTRPSSCRRIAYRPVMSAPTLRVSHATRPIG